MLVDELGESPILGLIDQIFREKAAGKPVIELHIGEPDFATPAGIRDAAYRAMNEGYTHYVSAQGMPELRSAIAARLGVRNRIPATADDIVVLPAKFGIYATLLSTVGPGDEVLLPDPTYLFEHPIRLVGATPVYFPLKRDFSFDPNALFDAITPKSRLLLLVSPSNPTGRVLRKSDVRDAVDIAAKKGLTIVSDETYESLVYDGTHVSPASLGDPEVPIVTIGSFSKLYAMTGWRAGYLAAPPPIRARVVKVMEHTLTCLPPFVQRACLWALEHGAPDEAKFREAFRERRDHLIARLEDLPGISCTMPEGAFYAFPEYDLKIPSVEFCSRLLREEHVALVPGVAFGPGGERHVRIAYTNSLDALEEGTIRLGRFLDRNGAQRG